MDKKQMINWLNKHFLNTQLEPLNENEFVTIRKLELKNIVELLSSPVEPEVMPLLIKDNILIELQERLDQYERQLHSDYGFPNKQKISYKVAELKKCIQIVKSA